jgi:hypothetical protein
MVDREEKHMGMCVCDREKNIKCLREEKTQESVTE